MTNPLKEYYRDHIAPCTPCGSNCNEINDLKRLSDKTRQALMQGLTDEQKATLEKYEERLRRMNELICEDSFVTGYRLGTRMTVAALSDE